jgi:hypothetical protein
MRSFSFTDLLLKLVLAAQMYVYVYMYALRKVFVFNACMHVLEERLSIRRFSLMDLSLLKLVLAACVYVKVSHAT